MNSRENRWLAIGVAFVLFGAVDLVALLLTPGPQRGWVLVPPLVAAVATLFVLPYVLGWFQKQEDRIARQRREIETVHAMDTAIAAENELGPLLDVAARRILGTADAEAGGVALFAPGEGPDTKTVTAERFLLAQRVDDADAAERFAQLTRTGGRPDRHWEAIVAPVSAVDGERGYVAAARYRPAAPFTDDDRDMLRALAGTVGVAVTNARRLEAARQAAQVRAVAEQVRADAEQVFAELERERRVAQALTEGLLPDVPARLGPWGLSRCYVPQSEEAQVGGDIYDLFALGDDRLCVVIADVSGKGLAAARKTAMVKYSLRSYAREHPDAPGRVLERLNDALTDEPELTGFVTLFYGVLEAATGRLAYASAGHEPPLVRRAAGGIDILAPTGMVLGAMRDMPYGEGEARLAPGDGFLLYTDGLTEARPARGRDDFLTIDGAERLLEDLRGCPPERLADELLARLNDFTGGFRADDTALLWVERTAAGDAA